MHQQEDTIACLTDEQMQYIGSGHSVFWNAPVNIAQKEMNVKFPVVFPSGSRLEVKTKFARNFLNKTHLFSFSSKHMFQNMLNLVEYPKPLLVFLSTP